ncbi:MAG: YmfQ family protein [Firmicutes bacterium]|nr:YmfQ family protein [Bacillota bacterium]
MNSATGRELLAMLPPRLAAATILAAIIDVRGMEFDAIKEGIEDVRQQLLVETATWALDRWEADYKLKSPAGYTDEERREPIIAKMRAPGRVSIEQIKKVAQAYARGLVKATANPDATITVQFIDKRGIPGNIEALKAEIRNIAPAHLDLVYIYLFTLVQELIDWDITVGGLTAACIAVEELKTWEPA